MKKQVVMLAVVLTLVSLWVARVPGRTAGCVLHCEELQLQPRQTVAGMSPRAALPEVR